MRVTKRVLLQAATAMALGAVWTQAPAFNVTVNENTSYQTIECIGMSLYAEAWTYRSGPFYIRVNLDSIHYFDSLVTDHGFTAVRAWPAENYQATPGDFSVSGVVRTELENESKYAASARAHGEPLRILWSIGSPPPWMKANNSCCQVGANDPNNYLLPAHYVDFAQHLIHLLQVARDSFSVAPYAISLQNEPLFNEPYMSCNYGIGSGCGWNGVCYNQMFRVVAPLIHAAFPDVKLVAAEDLNRTTIEVNLRADNVSNPLVWAWATHNNYLSSFAYWTDRPIWNTEPHPISFLEDAQMCLDNLAAGASAWFDFADVDSVKNGVCTYAGTSDATCLKGGSYRALKMFARYVRPGALRVASTGTSGSYRVIAFYHPLDTCLTIVLVNGAAAATTATLSVTGSYLPSQLNVFQSTTSQDEAPLGQVAINGTVTLPAVSVTTLVSGRYTGTGATAVARATMAAPSAWARPAGVARLYALDGRLAATSRGSGVPRLAPGVYCTQMAWGGSARALQVRGLAP